MKLIAAAAAILLACASAHAGRMSQNEADILFKSALAAMQAGRYGYAIKSYRHLLREVPTSRIKLELARALYLAKRYDESLGLFKEVYLDARTPQSVKRNILPFMEGAELRTMRVRYGVRAITDSNPSRVSDGGTIFFNGVPLEYQPPASKKTSYGVEPWLSVEKIWNNGLLTKFYGSARLFEDDHLNAGRFQFAVARQFPSAPGLFVQVAVDTEVNHDNSYVLPSVEAWKRFQLSQTAGFGVGAQVGYMRAENRDASGGFYRPYVFGDWTFLPNATAFAKATVEHLDSRNDYYTYFAPKLDFGVDFKVGSFEFVPQVTVTHTMFSEYDPFWGLKRRDTAIRPALTLANDRLEWNGLRPELNIFYESRDSNVDIYDYDQAGGFMNLTRLF